MCLQIYGLDPAHFLQKPGLTCQETKAKLDLSSGISILSMVEKDISGGISQAIYPYTKGNNKHMKDYGKNNESLYVNYCDVSNLCG